MNICRPFFIGVLTILAGIRCQAMGADTASVRPGYVQIRPDSVRPRAIVSPVTVRLDTAVVRSYNGIPVFYHCQPLHHYVRVGYMTRTTLVSYISQAFDRYTRAARKKTKGHLGILIDNMNYGVDSFDVVRFSAADGSADTAVFSTPIFLNARPTKPYKVVRIIKDQFGYGSLNANLQDYYEKARRMHLHFDGIMLRDINYGFAKDNVFVFRWRDQ